MEANEIKSDDIALDIIESDVIKDEVIEMSCVDETDGRKSGKSYYHSKKSVAEGMMDISLLTANANQLRFLIFYNANSSTFYPAFILIIMSLLLQIVIGFLLIFRVSLIFNHKLISYLKSMFFCKKNCRDVLKTVEVVNK